ncbi:MAG: glycosyl hydrolase family 28-related protein, partial [Opitutaceae bacterium]
MPALSRRQALGLFTRLAATAGATSGLGLVGCATKNSARTSARAGPREFNVRDFGAIGDGTTLDTAAIQRAIDAAAAVGGRVIVP